MVEAQRTPSESARWVYPIVVGVDLDPLSEHALTEALHLAASRPGAAVHVLHAIATAPLNPHDARALDHTEALLETVPARLRGFVADVMTRTPGARDVGARDVSVTLHVRVGPPADTVIQLAVDVAAELIVVATHGRQGIRRLALGSVAGQLVQSSPCPVLVARPRDYTGMVASAALEPTCPECARVRRETGDTTRWCDRHGAAHPRPHVVSYHEVFDIGRNGGGIV